MLTLIGANHDERLGKFAASGTYYGARAFMRLCVYEGGLFST
jgi:hypothetical protein